jgi:hypothetical protein
VIRPSRPVNRAKGCSPALVNVAWLFGMSVLGESTGYLGFCSSDGWDESLFRLGWCV